MKLQKPFVGECHKLARRFFGENDVFSRKMVKRFAKIEDYSGKQPRKIHNLALLVSQADFDRPLSVVFTQNICAAAHLLLNFRENSQMRILSRKPIGLWLHTFLAAYHSFAINLNKSGLLMRNTHFFPPGLERPLGQDTRAMTKILARRQFESVVLHEGLAGALTNITTGEVLAHYKHPSFTPRLETVNDKKSLASNVFFRQAICCYAKSAQGAYVSDASLADTFFEQEYPSSISYNGNGNKKALIQSVSYPFFLLKNEGEAPDLGCYETLEISGAHHDDYRHISPMIKRGSRILDESERLTREAAPFILKGLIGVSPRAMDVLEVLSTGIKDSALIGEILGGISKHRVEELRQELRNAAKQIAINLNDFWLAFYLKEMDLI